MNKIFNKIGFTKEQEIAVCEVVNNKICKNIEDSIQLVDLLLEIALNYDQFKKEIELIISYLENNQAELPKLYQGKYLHIKGYHYWKSQNDILIAFTCLNNSISIFSDLNENDSLKYLARVHDTFGLILKEEGQYFDAQMEFFKSLKLKETFDDKNSQAITWGNLGRFLYEIGNYQKAVEYIKKDITYCESIENNEDLKSVLAKLYLNFAKCNLKLGSEKEAEKSIQKSISLNKEQNNNYGLLLANLELIRFYLYVKKPVIARELVNSIENELNNLKSQISDEIMHYFNKIKALYFDFVQDYKFAHKLYHEAEFYIQKSDSISLIDQIDFYYNFAQNSIKNNKIHEGSRYYILALEYLDKTDNFKMRETIENELKSTLNEAWMLYNSGRFVGHKHIEKLLEKAGSQGFSGESKNVIVLFLDIRDFTSISEKFKPQELVEFLNIYLSSMTKSIERFGGYVDKFIGDAVMAVFSLFDNENIGEASLKTVYAALLIQEEIKRLNRNLPEPVPHLTVGIGIHYGACVAGLIGSPQKRSYTLIGDTVNLASRLEGMTKLLGASILISESLYERLPSNHNFLIRTLGKFAPKGKSNPVAVYDVLGLKDDFILSELKKTEIEKCYQGFEYLYQKEFKKSASIFNDLLKSSNESVVNKGYKLIIDNIKKFEKEGVPKGWQGEIVLTNK